MNKHLKSAGSILLAVTQLFTLTGCWNRRELNTLAIVMGVGIDKASEGNEIELTTQIVKTDKLHPAEGQSAGDQKAYFNLVGTGTDVFTILRSDTHKVSRKLYIPYNQVIILGEDLAKEGVQDYLDVFMRDHEARLNVNILVAQGKANDVLDFEPDFGKIPASSITQLLENRGATSQTSELELVDFMKCLTCETTAAVAPMISTEGTGKEKRVEVSAGAVLKRGKMVGKLTEKETRGQLWVTDEIKSGLMNVKVDQIEATIENIKAKTKVTPILKEDGTIQIKIRIKQLGTLGSQTGTESLATPEKMRQLNQETEQAIEEEIQQSIQKARELNADIFKFGELVHQKYPKEWKTLEPEWDTLFQKIDVEIDVTAQITGIGRLGKPTSPEKEQDA